MLSKQAESGIEKHSGAGKCRNHVVSVDDSSKATLPTSLENIIQQFLPRIVLAMEESGSCEF